MLQSPLDAKVQVCQSMWPAALPCFCAKSASSSFPQPVCRLLLCHCECLCTSLSTELSQRGAQKTCHLALLRDARNGPLNRIKTDPSSWLFSRPARWPPKNPPALGSGPQHTVKFAHFWWGSHSTDYCLFICSSHALTLKQPHDP